MTRTGRWSRGRCRSAVQALSPGNVIAGKSFTVARDRIHDRIDMLPMVIRVSQTEDVPEFVHHNPPDVCDDISVRPKPERAPIGIEVLSPIKKDVCFDHARAFRSVVSHRQGPTAKRLSKNTVGKNDRARSIAG